MGTGTLLLGLTLLAGKLQVESRTLTAGAEGGKAPDLLLMERIVGERRIVLRTRTVRPDGSLSFSHRELQDDGTPITIWQEGFWNDRWNRFETTYDRNGARQRINEEVNTTKEGAKAFRNPTVLWFWRTMPKVGESVVVKFLAQNVISTFEIRFTYEGVEELTLAGRKVKVHRVREDPLSAKGVYTIWWYDEKGMGVRRYHKTTTSEFASELKAWQ